MHCKLLRDTPPQQNYLTHHFSGFFLFFIYLSYSINGLSFGRKDKTKEL